MSALLASLMLLVFGLRGPAAADVPAAEVVVVEDRGPTSLAGFDCTSIARSAVVTRVCHHAGDAIALAEVRGRWLAWCDVPRALVDAWLAAPSMGRFHAERLAGAPRCPGGRARDRRNGRARRPRRVLTCRPALPGSSMVKRQEASKAPAAPAKPVSRNAVGVAAKAAPARRGRPPRRVYINVLVKATTREGLTRLKALGELASQGEVIDELVSAALAQRARRGS
ncbi:MAG TPA: hypothetical protein VEA81_17490 [Burkholderiaceae bacterium]|nr:hypothetical protein [Burkholderiaceae bacterium]